MPTAATPFPPVQLSLEGITCRRGGRTLFENLDLTLTSGDGLRLLGPNGAGKTSLLRLLAGLLPPASGRATLTIDGGTVPAAQHIHLLAHLDAIKPSLTVEAALRFWTAYSGDGAVDRHALARVGLADLGSARCGDLSAGQRRRLNLARIIGLRRPIWLLDEPTAALDAEGQTLLEALMKDHRAAGGIIVAATHLPLDMPGARALQLEPAAS